MPVPVREGKQEVPEGYQIQGYWVSGRRGCDGDEAVDPEHSF